MTDETKPPYCKPSINAAPKIRQIYWCEFWKDAILPEFWKTRPVIIVSYKNALYGHCLVIPVSTKPENGNNEWAYKISIEIEEGIKDCWAICNHPYTVATSRLTQIRGKIPLLPKEDFNQILDRLMKWLADRRVSQNTKIWL